MQYGKLMIEKLAAWGKYPGIPPDIPVLRTDSMLRETNRNLTMMN